MSSDGGHAGVESREVVVLGGGVAGLFAASALRDVDVVLLEGSDRVGGRVESVRRDPYWLNVGAQFAEGEGPLIEAMDRLRIERGSLTGKKAAFAWNGKVVPSHSPVRLILGTRMSPLARVDLARLGLRLLRAYRRVAQNKDRKDAAEFRAWLDARPASVLASKVRTDEVRRVFRGWVQHWVGCEPDELAAGQFVLYMGSAMLKAQDVPNFSLPVGGNQTLTDAVAEELGDRVRLGSTVSAVTWDESGVEVAYSTEAGPARIRAERCIVALTADSAAGVLRDLDAPLRDTLAAVKYGHYVLAGIFTDETGPQPWDGLYAIATPGLSFQVMYNHAAAVRRDGPRTPGGALVCYAGGDRARELRDVTDDEVRARFTRDLGQVFPGMDRVVKEMIIRRVPRVVPYWSPGDREGMRALRAPVGRLHFAGDYLGYPSMTTAAYSGDLAGRAALELLGTRR